MLYDTHAHVNFGAFKENAKEIIKQTLDKGVWLNNVGTQKDTSAEAVRLAKEFKEGVYAVIGIHPIHTSHQEVDEEETRFKTREEEFDYDFYSNLAKEDKVVGLGETGLDYYRLPEAMTPEDARKIQTPVFEAHIDLANELDKALVIHCRATKDTQDAYEDVLAILSKKQPKRFEIHSFTGTWDIAKRFLDLGAYVALNGIITFDKTGVLEEVAKNVPLERIILETDAPYLAPVPFRGKQNLPEYVAFTAEKLAEIKGADKEEVAEATTKNARKLFKV